tara:strand:- start:260 stop:958 length:699 start_codon:yes stop_codon:yes gene_type:complete
VDIPFGMIIGALGALFIHHLQPRLRNDHGKLFEGVDKEKVVRHTFWEGAVTLVLLTLILSAVAYQEDSIDDRVSMRLGGGDTTYEIVSSLRYGEDVTTSITNMDDSLTLKFTVIWVDKSVQAMDQGVIDWSVLEEMENQTIFEVEPGETIDFDNYEKKKWHLVILHNEAEDLDDVIEVRILNEYDEDLMWKAIAISIPSLWMTGFVFHRLYRLKKAGRSLIDSTPSHMWEEE